MRINPFKTATILALGAATLWAADPWEEKDFTQWGEKEIRKVLTDSPWSQSISVKTGYVPSIGGGAPLGRVSEGAVTGGGGQAGVAPSTAEAVPRGGGGSVGRRVGSSDRLPPRTRMLIRWVSALPVKRAMVKQRFGSNPIGPEGLAYLDQKEAYYRISVLGVPRQLIPGSDDAEGVANLKQIIFLKRKNKKDIFPEMVDVQPQQRIVVVYAQFPRTDAVTLDDGRVELVMNFNAVKVKRKFKLKDMVFEGRLEL